MNYVAESISDPSRRRSGEGELIGILEVDMTEIIARAKHVLDVAISPSSLH